MSVKDMFALLRDLTRDDAVMAMKSYPQLEGLINNATRAHVMIIDRLEARYDEACSMIASLEADLCSSLQEIKYLKERVHDLHNEANKKHSELMDANETIASLNRQLNNIITGDPYDDPAHEADMARLRREQLMSDISPEEATEECARMDAEHPEYD